MFFLIKFGLNYKYKWYNGLRDNKKAFPQSVLLLTAIFEFIGMIDFNFLTQLAVQMLKNAVIVLKFHSKQPIFGYKSAETLVFG